MSKGPRIPLTQAQALMTDVIRGLSPYCQRIEPAGSVRRCKPAVGDLEVVLVPRFISDMFGAVSDDHELNYIDWARLGWRAEKDGPRYKKIILPTISLDINIVIPPAQWGLKYVLATGPAEFNQAIVTPRNQGGLLPSYMSVSDACIKAHGKTVIETPDEESVFRVLELDYIPPQERTYPLKIKVIS